DVRGRVESLVDRRGRAAACGNECDDLRAFDDDAAARVAAGVHGEAILQPDAHRCCLSWRHLLGRVPPAQVFRRLLLRRCGRQTSRWKAAAAREKSLGRIGGFRYALVREGDTWRTVQR